MRALPAGGSERALASVANELSERRLLLLPNSSAGVAGGSSSPGHGAMRRAGRKMRPAGEREGAKPPRMGDISRRAHGERWDRTAAGAAGETAMDIEWRLVPPAGGAMLPSTPRGRTPARRIRAGLWGTIHRPPLPPLRSAKESCRANGLSVERSHCSLTFFGVLRRKTPQTPERLRAAPQARSAIFADRILRFAPSVTASGPSGHS